MDLVSGVSAGSNVPGSFNANLDSPLIHNKGGRFNFPITSIPGMADGGITLALEERPEWADMFCNDGEVAKLTAASFVITDLIGVSMKANITVSAIANAVLAKGIYILEATAAREVNIIRVSEHGFETVEEGLDIAAADDVAELGMTFVAANDLTVGDRATFEIHATGAMDYAKKISFPNRNAGGVYRLIVSSAPVVKIAPYEVNIWIFKKIVFAGLPLAMNANESSSGVELTGTIQATPGEDPYERITRLVS